ncbi:MAG: hypothetical protein IJI01_06270 [Butyrivibrio sp.]|uniref:hypothetical protein n=1 Tax=Butyrivibrio sp. TaxID=28121 RepID=UPI0025B90039|nr:hypothetical protein [Butyrivibrio sp.]MBQ6588265.1 hypothetical protein [Butyrivibrio sp.]
MNNLLYIYEEVCDLVEEKEIELYEREDAQDKFICQFAKGGSSLHVKTIMQSRFVLYATEKDFNLIKKKSDEAGTGIVLKESKKEEIELIVSQYEEVGSKAMLFIRNGNKGLLNNPEEKKLPHVIYFFTNENLEFVLDCIKEGLAIKEKATKSKSVAARGVTGTMIKRTVVAPKPKLPELTDDEIREAIPEGCEVSHVKYGTGVVKSVLEGKIKVLFEDSVEKIFAGSLCVNKKILTVLNV